GEPYAAATAASVVRTLDEYGRDWAGEHTDACAATALRREQSAEMLDRRMACLESRRQELDALAETLGRADAKAAQRAAGAATALAPIEACRNVAALSKQPAVPSDPERRARLAELTATLQRVKVLRQLRKWRESMALEEPWLTVAPTLGYQPAFAELLFSYG